MNYDEIKGLVAEGWENDNPTEQVRHLNKLNQYYAFLTQEKVNVEDLIRQKSVEFVGCGMKQFEYTDSKNNFLAAELKVLGEIDGLLKVLSKQQTSLITVISLHKTEMTNQIQAEPVCPF